MAVALTCCDIVGYASFIKPVLGSSVLGVNAFGSHAGRHP